MIREDIILEKYLEAALLSGMDLKEISEITGLTLKYIKAKEKSYVKHDAPILKRLSIANLEEDESFKDFKIQCVRLGDRFFKWQIGLIDIDFEEELKYKSFIKGDNSRFDSLRMQLLKSKEDNKVLSLEEELEKLKIKTKSPRDFPKLKDISSGGENK